MKLEFVLSDNNSITKISLVACDTYRHFTNTTWSIRRSGSRWGARSWCCICWRRCYRTRGGFHGRRSHVDRGKWCWRKHLYIKKRKLSWLDCRAITRNRTIERTLLTGSVGAGSVGANSVGNGFVGGALVGSSPYLAAVYVESIEMKAAHYLQSAVPLSVQHQSELKQQMGSRSWRFIYRRSGCRTRGGFHWSRSRIHWRWGRRTRTLLRDK
jgi:hypothetical protein